MLFRSLLNPASNEADGPSQRRIFDSGYYLALNKPNFSLIEGSIQEFKKHSVVVSTGEEVKADIIVLSTVRCSLSLFDRSLMRSSLLQGFKAQDCNSSVPLTSDASEVLNPSRSSLPAQGLQRQWRIPPAARTPLSSGLASSH